MQTITSALCTANVSLVVQCLTVCVVYIHVYPSLYVIAMLPLSLLLLISLKLESAYHHYFVDPAGD
jgi:hypothetical protein